MGLEWNFEFVFPRSPKSLMFFVGFFHFNLQGKVLLMVGSTSRVLCIVVFLKPKVSWPKTPLRHTQLHSPETIGRSNRWSLGKEKQPGARQKFKSRSWAPPNMGVTNPKNEGNMGSHRIYIYILHIVPLFLVNIQNCLLILKILEE